MLIATVPYVGKRLHLDPDPELITDPDLQIISAPAGSGSTTLGSYIDQTSETNSLLCGPQGEELTGSCDM
jgi:hypothetical protein